MTTQHTFPAERTAVLTGAASARGIGRATADRLASEGWSIAILDINAEDAKAAAAEIGSSRAVKAIGVGADVSDEASVDRAITEIEEALPPIVGLVNLAGISSPTPFMETTVAEWDKVFAINMQDRQHLLHLGPAWRRHLLQGGLQRLESRHPRFHPCAGP